MNKEMALRAAKAECRVMDLEAELAGFKSHDRCNAGMRSEIKTLTEALAAMRGERDEFERKGIELCQVFGHLLMDEQMEPRAALREQFAILAKYSEHSYPACPKQGECEVCLAKSAFTLATPPPSVSKPEIEGDCKSCGQLFEVKREAIRHSASTGHHVELVGNQRRKAATLGCDHPNVDESNPNNPKCLDCPAVLPGQEPAPEASKPCGMFHDHDTDGCPPTPSKVTEKP